MKIQNAKADHEWINSGINLDLLLRKWVYTDLVCLAKTLRERQRSVTFWEKAYNYVPFFPLGNSYVLVVSKCSWLSISVSAHTCIWKDQLSERVDLVMHLRILALIGPMLSKSNVKRLAPGACSRWFQTNG